MTILRHAHLVTMDEDLTEYPDGFIVFDEDGIKALGDEKALDEAFTEGEDLRGALVVPGLVNTHTHLGMVPFRSLADDCPDRLHRFLMPLENRAMTRALCKASTKMAVCEMLLSGTTAAVDMYYFESSVAEAAEELGFRLWAGETFVDLGQPDGRERAFEELEAIKQTKLVTPVPAPHALYSVSEETLLSCVRYARERSLPWTMHLEEMPYEMTLYRTTPVKHMEEIGALDDSLIAAHLILATDDDIGILAKHGVSCAHCPGSNSKAAKGVAPVPEMLGKGMLAGLGTDGPASGNTLDLLTQLKLYALLQKNSLSDRSAVPSSGILPLATRNAGLMLKSPIGQLREGFEADIAVFSLDKPNMVPCYDPYSVLVYSAQSQNIKDVYVAGKLKVRDGQLSGIDYESIKEELLRESRDFGKTAREMLP